MVREHEHEPGKISEHKNMEVQMQIYGYVKLHRSSFYTHTKTIADRAFDFCNDFCNVRAKVLW